MAVVASSMAIAVWGCGEKRPGADEQFRQVIGALRSGSLAQAYGAMMPASYDRDLNEVLGGLRDLLGEEDFAALRGLTERAGERLALALGARQEAAAGETPPGAPGEVAAGARSTLLGIVSRAAESLPALLGLDDEAAFRRRDVRGFLELLDRGLFVDLAREARVRSHLETLHVGLVDSKGDWARLLFRIRGDDGRPRDEVHEVVLVEGKWVLNAWAVQWDVQVASWKAWVRDLEETRRKDPSSAAEVRRSAEGFLESLPAIVESVVERLRAGPAG